uniref:Uncharacterized protein n=1 Tax=Arundo donax TaxID=35708 RepID=A0A0A8XZP3_ARUDO
MPQLSDAQLLKEIFGSNGKLCKKRKRKYNRSMSAILLNPDDK